MTRTIAPGPRLRAQAMSTRLAHARDWRERNRAEFDANEAAGLYAPDFMSPVHSGDSLARELEHARAWRVANRPYFDAIYGA